MTGPTADPRGESASAEEHPLPVDWGGTPRYEVVRCIGSGGMGVVYEAFDRTRRRTVALKRLRQFSPAALYRFKREFRTLADTRHPNLVRLYELEAADEDSLFFTMELVDGVDFLRHVRAGAAPSVGTFAVDPPRLRAAIRELALGVHSLHVASKVHRDIKPSNVLVTRGGRVVLLDFGLAAEVSGSVPAASGDLDGAGTPTYVAPEQILDEPPSPAGDWYSVGVLLYEALVGAPPFRGAGLDVLDAKLADEAPVPSRRARGVPADLEALCVALLRRDPAERPNGVDVLRACGAATDSGHLVAVADRAALVGREEHLRILRALFDAARGGRATTVRVHGAPGMGKSALVQHFVDDLTAQHDAIVLRGRAYEQESVPYKAIDGAIDALTRYLKREEDAGAPVRLPANTWALGRLFPVLRAVSAIAALPEGPSTEPLATRHRAVGALRQLFAEVAARQPLVLYLDDVQWGDVDSASLLIDVMNPLHAPPVLLVMTYRDGEVDKSAFLRAILSVPECHGAALQVGPLGAADAERLARARLGDVLDAERIAAALARESGGSAFLVEELVCTALAAGEPATGQDGTYRAVTLEQMVAERLDAVGERARDVAELVAVNGKPLPLEILERASSRHSDGASLDETIGVLGDQRFVTASTRAGAEAIESSHDRIRETIVGLLGRDALRDRHARLAEAYESAAPVDDESVVFHRVGSGEPRRAGQFALRAAEHAADKLAFDRADALFALALEALPPGSEEGRAVQRRRAEVLECAGRSAEAGRVYLQAAEGAQALERSEIESAAAMQLLYSGRIDEGARILPRSLAAVGVRVPGSALGALVGFLVLRLWLKLRGVRVIERGPEEITAPGHARVEALYTAAFGMTFVDVIVGACMQAKHMLVALAQGDPFQLMRAIALEACHYASAGGPEGPEEARLDRLAAELGARVGGTDGLAFLQACRGVRSFLHGDWARAHHVLDAAYENLPQHRAGWHSNTRIYNMYALVNLGDVAALANRLPALLDEADERGDLFTSVALRLGPAAVLHLAADEPHAARDEIERAMASWSQQRYLLQHWRATCWRAEIDLYEGDPGRAYDRMARDARKIERSLLLRVQYIRGVTCYLRARCALGSLARVGPAARRERVREAARAIRQLERDAMPWTLALAAMASAALASARGRTHRARVVEHLRAAIERADSAGMGAYASAARWRLAALLGRDEGRALLSRAETAMSLQGIRAPARFVAMLLPWPGEG